MTPRGANRVKKIIPNRKMNKEPFQDNQCQKKLPQPYPTCTLPVPYMYDVPGQYPTVPRLYPTACTPETVGTSRNRRNHPRPPSRDCTPAHPHTHHARGPTSWSLRSGALREHCRRSRGAHCATFCPAHNTHPTGRLHGRPGRLAAFQRRPGGMTGPRPRAHPGSTARHTPCDHGRDRRGRPQLLRGGAAPPSESPCASNRIKPLFYGCR